MGTLLGAIEGRPLMAGGFTSIRQGLLEHIRAGKLRPFDLLIYMFLHLIQDWETCICFTNSQAIATQFGGSVSVKDVRQALYRLREKGYINYDLATAVEDASTSCYTRVSQQSAGILACG